MTIRFPESVTTERFLKDYWQKKPLLCKNALAGDLAVLNDGLTAETLAGLACEDDVEARLILCRGPADQWRLQHGPFAAADFTALAERDWSLLVQDVDKFIPQVAALLDHFDFLPSWRIDDVMVSFAAPGGTVGPHIDEYDVFLLQGQGTRRWDTGSSNGRLESQAPVPVLKEFNSDQSFELKTGDALYLPPGLAHFGHSETACMTLSVGFRAPSLRELVLADAEYRADRAVGRYRDPAPDPEEAAAGLISEAAVQRAVSLLGRKPVNDDVVWFGRLVTENKPWLQMPPPDAVEDRDVFQQTLQSGRGLLPHSTIRKARCETPAPGYLFVDGESWPLTPSNRDLAAKLCRGDCLSTNGDRDSVSLLYNLYSMGKLYWADE
ncbi:MAG: cupin domain-containing protein [Gammaproteobacteria bacterium]|nr:cupin domain-containing protein [Gammaproteobacteria bacterium]